MVGARCNGVAIKKRDIFQSVGVVYVLRLACTRLISGSAPAVGGQSVA